jgi:hypothetical protein
VIGLVLIAEQKSPSFHSNLLPTDRFIAEIATQKREVNSEDKSGCIGRRKPPAIRQGVCCKRKI